MGETLIHGKGLVGGAEHFAHRCANHMGHILAAIFAGHVEAGPAALAHLIEGVFKPCGGAHHTVFQPAAFGIAYGIQGREHV